MSKDSPPRLSIPEHETFLRLDSENADASEKSISSMNSSPSIFPRLRLWRCSHAYCAARPQSTRALFCRLVQRPFYVLVFIFGLASLFSIACDSLLAFLADARETDFFPRRLPSRFSNWLTHGVIPVPCHSHNDYWRHVPLYSALAAGCISVEADIWLDGDELLVGHTPQTVLLGHTLRSLYLDPLSSMLQQHNPRAGNESVVVDDDAVGVFVGNPSQTLVLLVDFKSDGESLWPVLMEQLQPLRESGYLSHFDGSDMIHRPITVVATGDAPFHRILENTTYRDIFYDAPLEKLAHASDSFEASHPQTDEPVYNAHNSYYASVDFRKTIGSLPMSRLSQNQLTKVRNQVRAAHERGLRVRYWGTPKWPVGLRNYVWRVLVRERVDVLNVDDLHGATRVDWKSRSWWI